MAKVKRNRPFPEIPVADRKVVSSGKMTRKRQRMMMTWAAIAGMSASAAFSSAVKDDGRDRIADLFSWGSSSEVVARIEPAREMAPDGSPMATGAFGAGANGKPVDVAELKAEIARLETAVRRAAIEKKALLNRIAEMRGKAEDAVDSMVTGSLPSISGNMPAGQPMPAGTQDAIRDALARSAAADLARGQTRVTETRFAVEVAAGHSLSQLRSQWDTLARAHSGLLGQFDPLVHVDEDNRGVTLRLLAGPMANAADAVDVCARLRNTGTVCAAVPYEGQRLNIR
ncbi:MAG: SPOR domain-containing protein [Rhodobiaceae bacterium]|nr:SPOR domain-containing protein [Rhodobiaceae bacterium]